VTDRWITACWLFAPLLVGGCATDVCACSPAQPAAVIHGSVRTGEAAPVDGAQVQAYSAGGEGCVSIGAELSGYFTAIGGVVSGALLAQREQDGVCVHVYADPPQGDATLGRSDTTTVILDFRIRNPQDSARVVLVLPPK
jgi:hypothetical protein